MNKLILIVINFVLSKSAMAAVINPQGAITANELSRIFIGLLVVIALILILSCLVKKLNKTGLHSNKGFVVIAHATLGAKEKVMLVQAGTRFLLLGVTAGSINTLHDFGEQLPSGFTALDRKLSFADFFHKAMRKT